MPMCSRPACNLPTAHHPRPTLSLLGTPQLRPPIRRVPRPLLPLAPERPELRRSSVPLPAPRTTSGSICRRAAPTPPRRSYHPSLKLQLFHQLMRNLLSLSRKDLRLLVSLRHIDTLRYRSRSQVRAQIGRRNNLYLFCLCLLNAHQ